MGGAPAMPKLFLSRVKSWLLTTLSLLASPVLIKPISWLTVPEVSTTEPVLAR